MMDYKTACQEIRRLYGGHGWPTYFMYIRLFITAPFRELEQHVPTEGLIVDLGCGYGIFSNLLGLMSDKRKILGIELNDFKMRYADKGISNVEFKVADITKINIPPADCILLIHVLHHLDSAADQEPLLRACVDKLKVGGQLIIAEINTRPWWKLVMSRIADRILYKFHPYYYIFPPTMLPLLQRLGLSVTVNTESHHGTPFSHITYISTKL